MMPEEVNILVQKESKVVILSDGKEYKLSPINLNVLANLEEEFGCDLAELGKKANKQSMVVLRSLLYVFLKENYPTMTKQQVGRLVSLEIMPEISRIIGEVWVKKI